MARRSRMGSGLCNDRRTSQGYEFGPNLAPIIRAQIPTHHLALGGHFDGNAQRGARLAAALARSQLGEVNRSHAQRLGKLREVAARLRVEEGA